MRISDRVEAYLTVYLALMMAVMLSLCLALIESVRQNAVFLEAECVTDIGLNSILAEFHKELFRQYNLFAVDASYKSNLAELGKTERRLTDYMNRNLSMEGVFLDWFLYRDFLKMSSEGAQLTKVSYFSDQNGEVFRRRAAEAVWDDMNLNLYEELKAWMQVVEAEELDTGDMAAKKRELDQELDSYNGMQKEISEKRMTTVNGKQKEIEEKHWVTIAVNNPTAGLEEMRSEGILKWVVEEPENLSMRTVHRENLISTRMDYNKISLGNMELPEQSATEQMLEQFFFHEYLVRYFGHYGEQSEEDALQYQLEYLIVGKENDIENLKGVVNILCAIREAANFSYLNSDQEKCALAELLANVLADVMLLPEATTVIKYILLLGWAFSESVYDVKCLLAGGKVPLMKDNETWHSGLETALTSTEEKVDFSAKGLSYADYLRILMMLEKEETLTVRAMNMVEADMRLTSGNEGFCLDGCIDALEACVSVKSAYGYSCEITRQKAYNTQ